MPFLGALEKLQLSASVPRGFDGYWACILELDQAGPWSLWQIEKQSNVSRRSISQYVQRLCRGGFAEIVEKVRIQFVGDQFYYRLLKRPLLAPRLRLDGSELPEPVSETLWRTMKMARTFTPSELASLASTPERPINLGTVRTYVADLARVEILAVARRGVTSRGEENAYRLQRNLGQGAPMVLKGRAVFDPNSRAVVGEVELKEARP